VTSAEDDFERGVKEGRRQASIEALNKRVGRLELIVAAIVGAIVTQWARNTLGLDL